MMNYVIIKNRSRIYKQIAITPPKISESLLLQRLIFWTKLFINGCRSEYNVKESPIIINTVEHGYEK